MEILFLSAWFPYPPDNGSRIRILNLIRQLSSRHEITLLSFMNHDRDAKYINRLYDFCKRVEVVQGRLFSPWSVKAIRGLLMKRPRWLVDVYSHEMNNLVNEMLDHRSFDVIIASQISMAPYLEGSDGFCKILEELEVSLQIDPLLTPHRFDRRIWHNLRFRKFAHYVKGLLQNNVDGCTVVSEQEMSKVLEIVPNYENISIIPNGVDLEQYTGDFGSPIPDSLVFTGVLSYFANFDALKFFLDDVWPHVKRVNPQAKVMVTGRIAGIPLNRLPANDGVVFTDYLQDIRPCVAQSQACIVPIRLGGGTRLKILEAMALGTPVVSTSKGAEGLAVEHEENILIADEPEAFANAVLDLMRDKRLRNKLSKNGKILVQEEYDWVNIGARLDLFLEQIVAGESPQ